MANNFPLGYNIKIQSLDKQFGVASEARPDRTEDIVAVTGEELSTNEAKAKVTDSSSNQYYEAFLRGYTLDKTAEELTTEAADMGVKNDEFLSTPDFIAEQALTVNNVDYSSADARVSTNYQIAQEIISDRQFEISARKGSFEKTLNSVDRFLRDVSPIGTIEAITSKTETQSRDILNAAVRLSPTEFRDWFNTFADDVSEEGIFAGNTLGALQDLTTETLGAGYDPNKGVNQAFAALDLIGIGQLAGVGVKGIVKTSMKSSTAIGRVGAIRGSEAAAEASETILRTSPDPEVLGNVAPSNLDLAPQPVRPSAAKFTEKFAQNDIIQGIDDLQRKGAFGPLADSEAISRAGKRIAEKYTKKVTNPVFDWKVLDEGLGNYVTSIKFGKASDGTPFKPMADGGIPQGVQRLADEISQVVERAAVAPVDVNDLSKGYVIEVSERVNLSGLQDAIDPDLGIEAGLVRSTLGRVMNNEIMGSAALRDVQRLTTISNMAEGSRAAVKNIIDPYTKSLQKLNAQERFTLQSVYTQLRDGKDAALRVRYTEGEFAVKYQQMHPKGLAPSDRAYDAYNALATVEEADYLLKTTSMLNRYIEKGYQNSVKIADDFYVPAKRVSKSEIIAKSGSPVEPPVSSDFVRLYHAGEIDPNAKLKNSFTTSKDYAKSIGGKDKLYYIDVLKTSDLVESAAINDFKVTFTTTLGAEDFKSLGSPSELRAKAGGVTSDAKIFDAEFGGKIRLEDLEGDDIPIWKLDKPTPDGQEYVVKPKQVRIIEPTDVMGYNPGGSRANPNLNYFVTLGDKRLKALMGTFSEKQAKTAVDQLGRIKRAIDEGDDAIDDIIAQNNDWNPSIQNYTDFKKLADEEGWDFTRGTIGYKGRNDDLLAGDVASSDVFTGMKADDYVSNDLRRNDRVLMDFGGGKAYNEDPINSVLGQMGNSVFTYSNRAYARNAMVGWVKKAQQNGRTWFPDGVSPNDYETLFREARVKGTDEFSRRMKELRDITMRKMNMSDESASSMANIGQGVAEFVFDGRVPFGIGKGKQLNLGDPSNGLLKIGFQSAFGFVNVSQFFMQSFHATTIMAISPKHGLKGAAMTIPVRAALRATTPELQQEAIKRLAKAASISEKDAGELFEYIRTSGRAIVDGDAIEDGTGVGFGISGWKGESMSYSALSGVGYNISKLATKGLDAGLYPFKQGERLARLTGINTAFFEFKAKFPNVSALSDEARQWITRREQDLTFNMSSLSRGKVQSGFMKVPTQWLSYTLRSMEAVFVGRNFTGAERARLATALMPMYGLTGFGLGSAADYIGEKAGIAPDSDLYITLKYGMIDGIIAALGGDVEIGVGQRLAPVGAIVDTYKKVTQESAYGALLGPSGEIAGNLYNAVIDATNSLLNVQTASLTEDVIKVLRQPSGLDNIAKAYGIWNNNLYRSKNGITLESEMTVGDGFVALFGFTPLEVVENYGRLGQIYTSNKEFSAFRKEVNRDAEYIFALMEGERGDVDKAIQLMQELHERISFSGFSSSQTKQLRKSARSSIEKSWSKIQKNLIEQDNKLYALQAARSILKGTE